MQVPAELKRAYIMKSVKEGSLPRYVYKYKSLKTNYALEFLTKAELYFSTFHELNDPFDCQIIVDTNNSMDEVRNFILRNNPLLPEEKIVQAVQAWFKESNDNYTLVNNTREKFMSGYRIHCFAGCNNNILMWSHYADSHRGICLKFDLLQDPMLFITPLKVKYEREYPLFNAIRGGNFVEKMFQIKFEQWSYEDELRVYKNNGAHVSFAPESLVEICVGCNTSEADTNRVKAAGNNSKFKHIVWKKAAVSKTKYKLDINSI